MSPNNEKTKQKFKNPSTQKFLIRNVKRIKKNRQNRLINEKEDSFLSDPTFFRQVTESNKPQISGVGRLTKNAILHLRP